MDRITLSLFVFSSVCIFLVFSASVAPNVPEATEVEEKEGVKGWGRPPYLSPPGIPTVFGNATTQGNVEGLFAINNSTLTAISGNEGVAMATLNSSAIYFAKPIIVNETDVNQDGWSSNTNGQHLGGFTVTAQEDVSAYAEGDYIQFINHGGSYATGFGESNATGQTNNPGPGTGSGWGSGWKNNGPVSLQNNQNSKHDA